MRKLFSESPQVCRPPPVCNWSKYHMVALPQMTEHVAGFNCLFRFISSLHWYCLLLYPTCISHGSISVVMTGDEYFWRKSWTKARMQGYRHLYDPSHRDFKDNERCSNWHEISSMFNIRLWQWLPCNHYAPLAAWSNIKQRAWSLHRLYWLDWCSATCSLVALFREACPLFRVYCLIYP